MTKIFLGLYMDAKEVTLRKPALFQVMNINESSIGICGNSEYLYNIILTKGIYKVEVDSRTNVVTIIGQVRKGLGMSSFIFLYTVLQFMSISFGITQTQDAVKRCREMLEYAKDVYKVDASRVGYLICLKNARQYFSTTLHC